MGPCRFHILTHHPINRDFENDPQLGMRNYWKITLYEKYNYGVFKNTKIWNIIKNLKTNLQVCSPKSKTLLPL